MRLENCCVKEIRRGKSPKYAEISNVIVFAQKCNTKYNGIDISLAQYLDKTTIKRYPTDEHMQDGDIVINSTGTGTLGRVGIYRNTDNTTGLLIVPDSHVTGASNFRNGHISLVRWTTVPQVITRRGDLLLTCKGTIGEIAHNNFGEAHIARQIMAIRNIYSLNVDFLALCIEYSMTKIKQAANGLIPGISREDILNLVIPIPPTKEQENICNKLKATFSAIEHIEKSLN